MNISLAQLFIGTMRTDYCKWVLGIAEIIK